MTKQAQLSHYELGTTRGAVAVLPEHRANTAANLRAGVIYVVELATGESFPCSESLLRAVYTGGRA